MPGLPTFAASIRAVCFPASNRSRSIPSRLTSSLAKVGAGRLDEARSMNGVAPWLKRTLMSAPWARRASTS